MDLGLKNKRVLITGGTKSIGRAIVDGFLAEGAVVGFCARDEKLVKEREKEWRECISQNNRARRKNQCTDKISIGGGFQGLFRIIVDVHDRRAVMVTFGKRHLQKESGRGHSWWCRRGVGQLPRRWS